MRREPAHERSGVRAGAHWPVDNARDGDPAAGNHPGVVAAANPAAAGRSSGRLFGVRTGSGAGIDEPHRPSPAWLGRVVPTGGDRVAVLVDVGPFDSPIVFMMASRFDEMSQQVFRARVELQHHDYFAATAQEDLLTVGVLLTPGTSSGRAWDTTMVAAKGDQELDPEYVAFIRRKLGTTTSPSTNRPPGRSRLATRANRSALPAASRWCTSSADTTRSSCPRQWVLETVHPRIGGGDLYGSSVGGPRFGQGLITGSQHESPDGHGPSYRSIEPTAVEPTSGTPWDGLHPSRAVARLPSDTIGPAC